MGQTLVRARALQLLQLALLKKVKRKWDPRASECEGLEIALSKQGISRVLSLYLMQKLYSMQIKQHIRVCFNTKYFSQIFTLMIDLHGVEDGVEEGQPVNGGRQGLEGKQTA